MFIIFLRFSENKTNAPAFLDRHVAWLEEGLAQGQFILAGSIVDKSGGCIIATGIDRNTLDAVIAQDPFVSEKIVTVEIVEVAPSKVDQRLAFLKS